MKADIKKQLGMNARTKAIESRLHKTHHSAEYCRHCGKKTRTTTTHESGHREYDHEMASVDAPKSSGIKR